MVKTLGGRIPLAREWSSIKVDFFLAMMQKSEKCFYWFFSQFVGQTIRAQTLVQVHCALEWTKQKFAIALNRQVTISFTHRISFQDRWRVKKLNSKLQRYITWSTTHCSPATDVSHHVTQGWASPLIIHPTAHKPCTARPVRSIITTQCGLYQKVYTGPIRILCGEKTPDANLRLVRTLKLTTADI